MVTPRRPLRLPLARPAAAPGSPDPSPTATADTVELAPLVADADACRDLPWALQQEWVVTNGIGDYAASTILGVNTRRHHGLLVAATRPPGARAVLLAKVEETLVAPGTRYDLSTNQYAGVMHPEGYRYQEGFRLDPWPTFIYRVGGFLLEKTICLLPGEHTVAIRYWLREGPGAVELILRPLVACRDFRWVSQENPTFRTRVEQGPGTVILHPYESLPPLAFHHGAELFEPSAYWYKHFAYLEEAATETVHQEDLYSPGQLVYLLRPGETAELVASTSRTPPSHWVQREARVTEARLTVLRRARARRAGPLTSRLIAAAEQFLVREPDGSRQVMASYPWGTAAGRVALVALPGLTLATGQPEVARDLFQTLASHCRDGLLPVRFAETDGAPEYDSVDTSLWLFWAVDRYLRATGDARFVGRRLLDVLMDIVDYYVQGTQFHIIMDQDGLITTEGEELPLTWMDAQVDGHPVTRRAGKAIEVNALWYNALMTMADLGDRFHLRLRRQYARLARLVRANCVQLFWNADHRSCYDVVGRQPDQTLRPNQLFAVGLPYPLLPRAPARAVLELVGRELLTPVGVRTLSPSDPAYRGQGAGAPAPRDVAAYQGGAWPWLLGAYWSGYVATYGTTATTVGALRQTLGAFGQRLSDGAWGTVPEWFDGAPPHPRAGAMAHAWSVAELLRLLQEHSLTDL